MQTPSTAAFFIMSADDEGIYDLEVFQAMSAAAAKEYFTGLFFGVIDADKIETIWRNVPSDISTTMQIDLAVSAAVDRLDEINAISILESDIGMVNNVLKADRRREAKKRQKERKRTTEEKESTAKISVCKNLTDQQLECVHSVRDVLKGFDYHFSVEGVVNTLRKHNFDANAAVDELINFGIIEDVTTIQRESNVTKSRSLSGKPDPMTRHNVRTSPHSATADTLLGDHTVIRGNNASIVLSTSNNSLCSSDEVSSPCSSPVVSPLLQYYLMHLRTRNPGIIVSLEGDCMVYKGTQADCCVVNEAGELAVSIDLHGQTRKPAVDILQSSILHYHTLLSTRHIEQYTAPQGVLRRSSKSQKANKSTSKVQFAEVKCVTITFVVGQGLHSVGAVPVLRNTLMQEVSTYWSLFDAVIDPENRGQIVVRVRRL